ncbi:DUF6197 family protein [Streptomyces sp. S1]|uniref:DUF6197 family protein n=1 Tax=Streptomyces sp. S1 TaxID=718288 RepID=UPI003D73FCC9
MTPEEHLLKAAEDVAEHGHAKDYYFDTGGKRVAWSTAPSCALGSIARAGDLCNEAGLVMGEVIADNHPTARLLADHLREKYPHLAMKSPDNYSLITTFNDDKNTTGEDVILAMKEAAHHG